MAISLPEGINLTVAAPVVASYGPWANRAAALAGISQWIRYPGMTVLLLDERKEYWFLTGTTDADLIEKKTSSGLGVATFSVAANGSASTTTTALTLTFSRAPTSLTAAQITVTNGVKGTLSGSGTTYTLGFTPNATGNSTVTINNSDVDTGAKSVQVYVAAVTPATFTVSANGNATSTTTSITITLSRTPTTTLTAAQITVTNGVKGTLSGSGTSYTLGFTPSTTGTTAVSIANSDIETGSKNVQVYVYTPVSPATFTVAANGSSSVATTTLTFTFNRAVTTLTAAQITVSAGTKGALSGSGTTWTLAYTAATSGNIAVSINNSDIETGNKTVQVYAESSGAAYTVTANGNTTTPTTQLTFTFSQAPTNLNVSQITVSSGTLGTLSGSGVTYTVGFTPSANGEITVTIDNPIVSSAPRTVNVYMELITYTVTANGSDSVDTTALTFTFAREPTNLTVSNINIPSGTIGALTGTGTTRTLEYTPVGTTTIFLTITHAEIDPSEKMVHVRRPTEGIQYTVSANGNSTTPTTVLTLYFTSTPTGLTAAQIQVSSGTKSSLGGALTTRTLGFTPAASEIITITINNSAINSNPRTVQVWLP